MKMPAERGYCFTTAETEHFRDINEKLCWTVLDEDFGAPKHRRCQRRAVPLHGSVVPAKLH